jgi:hypothetical protein
MSVPYLVMSSYSADPDAKNKCAPAERERVAPTEHTKLFSTVPSSP